jgi:Spy/CpxP family protein refolding chaperone
MIRARILTPFALACACFLGAATPQSAPQAPPVAAPGAAQPRRMDGDKWMARMADKLQLNDAQRASCKAILDKHRDALRGDRQALADARQAFGAALGKPDTPADTLRTLHRALADRQFDQLLEARTLRQELRAVLTPEQREQAARMEGRMEGMRMARRGMDGGWRHGMGLARFDGPQAPAPAQP